MTRKRVGDTLKLGIIRGGRSQNITVKLGESSAVL
jgi:S1-C subfamily serine protease